MATVTELALEVEQATAEVKRAEEELQQAQARVRKQQERLDRATNALLEQLGIDPNPDR